MRPLLEPARPKASGNKRSHCNGKSMHCNERSLHLLQPEKVYAATKTQRSLNKLINLKKNFGILIVIVSHLRLLDEVLTF